MKNTITSIEDAESSHPAFSSILHNLDYSVIAVRDIHNLNKVSSYRPSLIAIDDLRLQKTRNEVCKVLKKSFRTSRIQCRSFCRDNLAEIMDSPDAI